VIVSIALTLLVLAATAGIVVLAVLAATAGYSDARSTEGGSPWPNR
jgi:hypothetical protein